MGETQYTYSKSGNPLTIEGTSTSRTLTWDAENRLRRIYDSRSGQLHLYTYNHAGERALKRYGTAQAMAVNDKDAGALLDTNDNYSAYVSPYFVRHNNRYTKHYYAGAMRIASKMGASGSTYAAGTDEPDLYFYHTDHLGSTTYITDRKEVAQYVAYTPYGETFKEYKNVTPYKLNGKELDQETGYYYYGARYYDPGTVLWFGTDPLAYKYPLSSPYSYCEGNPIVFFDSEGMFKVSIKSNISFGLQWGFKLSLPEPIRKALPNTIGKMTEISGNIISVTLLDMSIDFDTESGELGGDFNFIGKDGVIELSNEIDVLGFSIGQEFDTKSGKYVKGSHQVSVSTPLSTTNIDEKGNIKSEISISANVKKILGIDTSVGITDINSNDRNLNNEK